MSYYNRHGKSNEVVVLYATIAGLISFMAGFGFAVSIVN